MALSKLSLVLLMVALVCAIAFARPQDEEGGDGGGAAAGGKSSLFEDIFNIPISVLQAVQRLLTNNAKASGAAAPPPEE